MTVRAEILGCFPASRSSAGGELRGRPAGAGREKLELVVALAREAWGTT